VVGVVEAKAVRRGRSKLASERGRCRRTEKRSARAKEIASKNSKRNQRDERRHGGLAGRQTVGRKHTNKKDGVGPQLPSLDEARCGGLYRQSPHEAEQVILRIKVS